MAQDKRTILDINSSYVEEEDATYLDTSTAEISEEESLLQSEIVSDGDDILTDVESTDLDKQTPPETSEKNAIGPVKQFIIKHEVVRKALHLSIGIFTLWLYTRGIHQTQIIAPLVAIFSVIFTNDFIRLRNPDLNEKVVSTFWFLVRESERNTYNGTLWYIAGLVIVFSVFPKDISVMSVMLLSWADTAASSFGRQFGKYTPQVVPGKSLAGCLASGVAGILSCYLLYGYFIPVYDHKVNQAGDILWRPETSNLNLHLYALVSGIAASVSELVTVFGIDDNFSIPVLSGVILYGVVSMTNV